MHPQVISSNNVPLSSYYPQVIPEPALVKRSRRTVLIAGDDAEVRFMFKSLLEMWKLEVAEAIPGEDSLMQAGIRRPDLVLLDSGIPFDDSLTTVSLLRSHTDTRDIPIIVISGFCRAEYKRAALDRGASEYLVKPVDFDELEHSVLRLTKDAR